MTFGVPYSFVPGTKAKADEINANFIDILDKIQTTNNKLSNIEDEFSEVQSSTETIENTKANIDLSNLNELGQEVLNNKADKNELDGNWVASYKSLCTNQSIALGISQNYDLSEYLPNDNNIYEIIFGVSAQSGTSSGNFIWLFAQSDFMDKILPIIKSETRTTKPAFGASIGRMIVGTERSFGFYNNIGASGATIYTAELFGYRKVK